MKNVIIVISAAHYYSAGSGGGEGERACGMCAVNGSTVPGGHGVTRTCGRNGEETSARKTKKKMLVS